MKVAFPDIKAFNELFESHTFNLASQPAPHCWRMKDGRKSVAMTLSPYCHITPAGEYRTLWVKPTAEVCKFVEDNCIVPGDGRLYFQVCLQDNGREALVKFTHNGILADRWLAFVDITTVPLEKH